MNSPAMRLSSSSSTCFSTSTNGNPTTTATNTTTRLAFHTRNLTFSLLPKPSNRTHSITSLQNSPIIRNRNPTFFTPAAIASPPSPATADSAASRLESLVAEFQPLSEAVDRLKRLIRYADRLPAMEESKRTAMNRVMGCTAQVWVDARMDKEGRVRFWADSDSEVTRGFCGCLVWVLDGASPEEVALLKTEDLAALNVGGIGVGAAMSRANTWYNVLISMQKKTKVHVAE